MGIVFWMAQCPIHLVGQLVDLLQFLGMGVDVFRIHVGPFGKVGFPEPMGAHHLHGPLPSSISKRCACPSELQQILSLEIAEETCQMLESQPGSVADLLPRCGFAGLLDLVDRLQYILALDVAFKPVLA